MLGVDAILQNRALIGSVNAHARDWQAAVEHLDRARPLGDALEAFVGLRVPVDRFAEAFDFGGVKATLRFGDAQRALARQRGRAAARAPRDGEAEPPPATEAEPRGPPGRRGWRRC